MASLLYFVLAFVLGSVVAENLPENNYPIIGLFTQPTTSMAGNCGGNCVYLAASYVKYLESAGARVVPINYYAKDDELDILFASLNGLMFPGGGSAYPASAQYMFDKVVAANDKGDFMPLWGTCMGFQWLLIGASKDVTILDPKSGQFDAYNYSIPLDFTPSAASSRLFSKAPENVYKILESQNVTMNNHHYGIYTEHFKETPSLSGFYNLLSTNSDRKGVNFASTIEAFKYPIYGSQWHPEKNDFEWSMTDDGVGTHPAEAIDHSPDAVAVAQYTADFFVEQARKSSHKFATNKEEDSRLIYNYPATKTDSGGSFVQEYLFANDFSANL
jgi:gamma-glutamyl hydrolase